MYYVSLKSTWLVINQTLHKETSTYRYDHLCIFSWISQFLRYSLRHRLFIIPNGIMKMYHMECFKTISPFDYIIAASFTIKNTISSICNAIRYSFFLVLMLFLCLGTYSYSDKCYRFEEILDCAKPPL